MAGGIETRRRVIVLVLRVAVAVSGFGNVRVRLAVFVVDSFSEMEPVAVNVFDSVLVTIRVCVRDTEWLQVNPTGNRRFGPFHISAAD